jgi:thiol-disulfide isomerase/thioredoxin
MMLLSVAVGLVAALCLVDLVLTLGVVRRLREHGERLAQRGSVGALSVRGAGEAVDDFHSTTTAGEPVSLRDLASPTLVGFFAPHCPACEEQLPRFLSYATEFAGPVLAVVAGDSAEYRAALAGAGGVVVEAERGPLQQAFGVDAYPSFLVVAGGVVVSSTHDAGGLPAHQSA